MRLLQSMCIAFSLFSAIPVPQFEWTEENMRFSVCFMPVVGLVIGFLLTLWGRVCGLLGTGSVFFAAGAAILPILLTGGIHMDGFCDTVDAFASHRDRAVMLDILKDSHTGAFAVIYAGVYLLAVFGLYSELAQPKALALAGCGFVLSRAAAALSTVTLQKARLNGLLASYTKDAGQKAVIVSMAIVTAITGAGMIAISARTGVLCLFGAAAVFLLYRAEMFRALGGVTGDTTGFLIQLSELMILVCVFFGHERS